MTADRVNTSEPITLITDDDTLAEHITAWARVPRLAVDVEANGMHAYRAALCAVQVGWRDGDTFKVAVIDTQTTTPGLLRTLFGCDGPLKLLHDFTFDASLLQQHSITLGHVEDTSVAARFLGEPGTGLASLAAKYLDIVLSKKLQSHNWAQRPFTDEQLHYLASDVRYLFTLRDILWKAADAAGISEEIAQERDYKLMMALNPRPPSAPAYMRIKGYKQLGDERRGVLRCLHAAREQLAERADRPPHYLASNRLLMDLAGGDLRNPNAVRRRFSGQRTFRSNADVWIEAIRTGMKGAAPPEAVVEAPPRMSRREISVRKRLSNGLNSWRKREAARRSVDVQVVIPGHCSSPLVDALLTESATADENPALSAIPGFGAVRIQRYRDQLIELAVNAAQPVSQSRDA